MQDPILLSVLFATLASMALGFLWYYPAVFGNVWLSLMKRYVKDMPDMNKKMASVYLQMFLVNFLAAYVLAMLVVQLNIVTAREAVLLATWLAIGFVATSKYTDVLFEGKRRKMFLVDAGYWVVNFIVMTLVLVFV